MVPVEEVDIGAFLESTDLEKAIQVLIESGKKRSQVYHVFLEHWRAVKSTASRERKDALLFILDRIWGNCMEDVVIKFPPSQDDEVP